MLVSSEPEDGASTPDILLLMVPGNNTWRLQPLPETTASNSSLLARRSKDSGGKPGVVAMVDAAPALLHSSNPPNGQMPPSGDLVTEKIALVDETEIYDTQEFMASNDS